jgi:hypothetical protein
LSASEKIHPKSNKKNPKNSYGEKRKQKSLDWKPRIWEAGGAKTKEKRSWQVVLATRLRKRILEENHP